MAIFLFLFINVCSLNEEANKVPNKVPEITVSSNNINIPHTVGLNEWNGAKYDREDTFKVLMKGSPTLSYIKLGNKIQIKFIDSSVPDKVKMLDYILNEDGTAKYTEKAIKTIPIKFENKKAEIILEQNLASMLSSNSADYEKGASIRGFRLVCSWGNNECEYAFVIKSDAR